jgi:peroxiredoxin
MSMFTKGLFAGAATLAIVGLATLTGPAAFAGKDAHGKSAHKDTAKVGEKAPDFTLTDIKGNSHTLSDYTADGKIVVLEWFNPTCPFVIKHHEKMSTMTDLAKKYDGKVVWLAINSGHAKSPTKAMNPKSLKTVEEWSIAYPMLVDESGEVGQLYGARTTPDMFIIDTEGVLRYSGAIDSDSGAAPYSDKEKKDVVNYVDQALQQVINGETVTVAETKSYGCGVKYAR